ncbi:hypothetical protein OSB04_000904 [Centaurea solstitialis]|uniref:Uncharacterized protein n=1 Tax=Centaurea solstitialis TaxID=347529 RepID=A0AA38U9B7_9ASTR|nr:hypothetical protein OSB04_000904 [Centaurea solstitialis]
MEAVQPKEKKSRRLVEKKQINRFYISLFQFTFIIIHSSIHPSPSIAMDPTLEDLKFIRSMGIITESFKTIFKWKKIFSQITLTLILPISTIFIAHMEISKRFFHKDDSETTSVYWLYYFLFKTISIAVIFVLCLLSTATVSYTVASIYTGCDISFRKAMKVVPKVWKRLILTLLSMSLALFAYNVIAAFFVFILLYVFYADTNTGLTPVWVLYVVFIAYVFGFLYLGMVWQLASVVSVLENFRGLKSMVKAMDLIKGKRIVALSVTFLAYTFLVGTVSMYMALVLYDAAVLAFPWKVVIGILCWILLLFAFLFIMVTQSVLYLVCKSHHREAIDKVSLSTYLGAYFGEEIQLGRPQPQSEAAAADSRDMGKYLWYDFNSVTTERRRDEIRWILRNLQTIFQNHLHLKENLHPNHPHPNPPLTIVFFAHMLISHLLFSNIESNALLVDPDTNRNRATIKDWLFYWLFKIIYFTVLTVFSLLSTAAVVFTIASVYTGREVFYKSVMKVVPKVWKRLFVTFIDIYLALFFYNIIGGGAMVICRSVLGYTIFGSILLIILLILYLFGFLYLSVVWQLASVVTVLENSHGLKAMRKGRDLIRGKKKLGMGIAFVLYVVLVGVVIVYELFVEYGDEIFGWAMVWRVLMGILCGFLLMNLFLLFFVTQTVLYLVCKSHHREAIDKLSLSTFLGAYSGETVVYPNVGEEIQLGRPQVKAIVIDGKLWLWIVVVVVDSRMVDVVITNIVELMVVVVMINEKWHTVVVVVAMDGSVGWQMMVLKVVEVENNGGRWPTVVLDVAMAMDGGGWWLVVGS